MRARAFAATSVGEIILLSYDDDEWGLMLVMVVDGSVDDDG